MQDSAEIVVRVLVSFASLDDSVLSGWHALNWRTLEDFAARALMQMGSPALHTMMLHLDAPNDKGLVISICDVLGRCGRFAEPAVGKLQDVLVSSDADMRMSAAESLGNLGMHARLAVPALESQLGQECDGECARTIRQSLRFIASDTPDRLL